MDTINTNGAVSGFSASNSTGYYKTLAQAQDGLNNYTQMLAYADTHPGAYTADEYAAIVKLKNAAQAEVNRLQNPQAAQSNTTTQNTTPTITVTENSPATAPDDRKVSVGDLPWAPVLMPPNVRVSRHALQRNDWVIGFFADGDDCQQPIVVGYLSGGPGAGSSSGGQAARSTPNGYQSVPSSSAQDTSGTQSNSPNNSGSIDTTGANAPTLGSGGNKKEAFKYLMTQGMKDYQAAGILGCIMAESGPNLDPTAVNKSSGATGICQWLGPRKDSLQAHASILGKPITDLGVQLSFLVKELKNGTDGSSGEAYKWLQKATNPQEAVYAFVNFERGEDWSKNAFGTRRSPNPVPFLGGTPDFNTYDDDWRGTKGHRQKALFQKKSKLCIVST